MYIWQTESCYREKCSFPFLSPPTYLTLKPLYSSDDAHYIPPLLACLGAVAVKVEGVTVPAVFYKTPGDVAEQKHTQFVLQFISNCYMQSFILGSSVNVFSTTTTKSLILIFLCQSTLTTKNQLNSHNIIAYSLM